MNKYLAIIIVFLTVFGITTEVLLVAFENGFDLLNGLRLFRYYTIQSNLIVMIYFILFLSGKYKHSVIFNKMLGGITVYVTITIIIFAVMLQRDFHPEGIGVITNIFLHYLVPFLIVFFLMANRKNYSFSLKDILLWIVYPLIYIIFMVSYGSTTGDYLYPFFDVAEIGNDGLGYTIIGLIVYFVIVSFIYVKIVSEKELTKPQ